MRPLLVLILALAAFLPQKMANASLVGAWYPILQTGNTWMYADEARDADSVGHGIADPTIGRWTTTETVSTVEVIPEGTRVTIRSQIGDLVKLKGWMDNSSLMTPPQTTLLVRGTCVYRLAGEESPGVGPRFRRALLRNDVPATYCFPMTAGGDWGRVPSTSPAGEDISEVKRLNGDPFGVPGAQTFYVSDYQGAGETYDYWFQEGVGIIQSVYEHHGTYDQHRRLLLRATISGVTETFTLQPARTTPNDPRECRDGWRHWIRADGTLISDLAACVAYAPRR
jgi:hypothetical protein